MKSSSISLFLLACTVLSKTGAFHIGLSSPAFGAARSFLIDDDGRRRHWTASQLHKNRHQTTLQSIGPINGEQSSAFTAINNDGNSSSILDFVTSGDGNRSSTPISTPSTGKNNDGVAALESKGSSPPQISISKKYPQESEILSPCELKIRKEDQTVASLLRSGQEQKSSTKLQSSKADSSDSPPETDIQRFRCASYLLLQAAGVGVLSGWSVGLFKIMIDAVKHLCYGSLPQRISAKLILLPLIPAIGGLFVATLRNLGGGFPAGMKETIVAVDEQHGESNSRTTADLPRLPAASYRPFLHQFRFIKKMLASVITLGTGCSLGPEGPSVEIGMNLARLTMDIAPPKNESSMMGKQQQARLLLACGAAAGVSAGFNAPLAGAFFALEIMQNNFKSIDNKANTSINDPKTESSSPLSGSSSMSAVLLSSVLSALVCQMLMGEHLLLALSGSYSLKTPLLELPLYLLLGAISGATAFLFTEAMNLSKTVFQGDVRMLNSSKTATFLLKHNPIRRLPSIFKPAVGGLTCGLIGLALPQVLFNGYDTINAVLSNRMLPTTLLMALLGVKMLLTAISAGSGLVGGTFAPSLFLGGMVGASFHNVVSWLFVNAAHHGTITLSSPLMQIADLPAYTMVGSATVLAAVFRAPLTASLLLFELTRDYGTILPLMASSGVASVVGDILESKFLTRQEKKKQYYDSIAVERED